MSRITSGGKKAGGFELDTVAMVLLMMDFMIQRVRSGKNLQSHEESFPVCKNERPVRLFRLGVQCNAIVFTGGVFGAGVLVYLCVFQCVCVSFYRVADTF